MSEAVGKTLKIIAVVAVAVVFAASVIASGGASLAIAASVTFDIIGKTALAIFAVGSALDPPQIATEDFKNDQGTNLILTADASPVRWQMLGETATAGTLIFRDAVGAKNEDLWLVIALAGHECTSLERFEWNGEEVTFTANNADGKYEDKMFLYFHNGAEDQVADAPLVAASSLWTSEHRGKGICYAVVKLVYDDDLFQSGLEEMRFYLKGAAAYDPRLDSTRTEIPGSGSHRVDDQSTWAHTENPALIAGRYMYGYRQGDTPTLIYGRGMADNRIDWVDIADAADSNEEQLVLKAGGTENRYTCNGVQYPNQTHNRNMSGIISSMAGMFYQTGDKWHVQSGVPRAAVNTRGTDDFIAGITSRGERDPVNKFNAVKGLFPDATQRTQSADYPSLVLSDAVIADGNQPHYLHLNLPFTDSGTMAQRISKISLQRTRMRRNLDAPFNAIGLQDAVADTIIIDHPQLNLNNMKMRLMKWEFRIMDQDGGIGFAIREQLEEEDDDLIYSWDETTEEQTPVSGSAQDRWDKEPYPATFVESEAGTTAESALDRVDAALEANAVLTPEVKLNQGDGVARVASKGLAPGSGDDGDAVSFGTAWDSSVIPEVTMISGGITTSASLTDPVMQILKPVAVTVSGFTISARLSEVTGALTPITDTGAVEDTTDIQWSMDKSISTEAYNDVYTFQFDVVVNNELVDSEGPPTFSAGQVIVGIYIDDGGGFVQFGTAVINGDDTGLTTTRNNQTKSVTVDGVGTIAGKEFRVINETGLSSGTLNGFDSVKYSTAAAVSEETASPSGAEPIKFQVQGGSEPV